MPLYSPPNVLSFVVTSISANYTIQQADDFIIVQDSVTGSLTITGAQSPKNKPYKIKTNANCSLINTVTFVPYSGLVDGQANFVMNAANEALEFVCIDGNNYKIFG